jgi:hypothetical protein
LLWFPVKRHGTGQMLKFSEKADAVLCIRASQAISRGNALHSKQIAKERRGARWLYLTVMVI